MTTHSPVHMHGSVLVLSLHEYIPMVYLECNELASSCRSHVRCEACILDMEEPCTHDSSIYCKQVDKDQAYL